jgi:hypothetical protein
MRLSVILPFYDETAFVHMAVQSVLSQGIDGAEILIVNDNPEAFPPGWLESQGFAPQVRILHHDVNRGLSAARNTGMAAAQGRIIGFLDSDDYYLTDGLTDQLALAESSGADMTHAGACISQPGTPALKVLPRDAALFSRARSGAGLAGIEEAQFITSSWSSLYRRDFLDGHGLRFDPEQVKFEDRLFVLQSVTRSGRIAVLGRPVRCWRRRAGSISVTPPDEGILRLQVQLLEKCMAVMRAHGQGAGIPARFLKREVFNTVSRLIWDMELIRLSVESPTDTTRDLAARVAALLGDDRLGQPIFDDPVLRRISRVGQPSRHGVIGRADFFDLHKALRSGDMAECRAILRARQAPAPVPARAPGRGGALDGRRLVLHLGLHKTASTWLQRQLLDQAPTLRARGILVPQAGLPGPDFRPVRPGGFPGHQGLLAALRRGDEAPWAALGQEVAASGCGTVVISCENMALPTDPDRDALLARLFLRLGGARDVRVVAFVRSPDTWAEAYWAEQVCNGLRAGARTLPEFLVDHGDSLTDLPALFAPFEVFAGAPVRLADHDAAAAAPGGHWAAFAEMAGLDLPPLPPGALARAYPGPDRAQIQAALALNALIAAEPLRARTLRAFFAVPAEPGSRASFLPPQARRALLTRFAERSADWAAARGYRPDLAAREARLAAEDWSEPSAMPAAVLDRLRIARLQAEHDPPPARRMTEAEPEPAPDLPGRAWGDDGVILRVRLRPWARRALARLGLGRRD